MSNFPDLFFFFFLLFFLSPSLFSHLTSSSLQRLRCMLASVWVPAMAARRSYFVRNTSHLCFSLSISTYSFLPFLPLHSLYPSTHYQLPLHPPFIVLVLAFVLSVTFRAISSALISATFHPRRPKSMLPDFIPASAHAIIWKQVISSSRCYLVFRGCTGRHPGRLNEGESQAAAARRQRMDENWMNVGRYQRAVGLGRCFSAGSGHWWRGNDSRKRARELEGEGSPTRAGKWFD